MRFPAERAATPLDGRDEQIARAQSQAVWVLYGPEGRVTRIDPSTGAAVPVGEAGRGAIGLLGC